MNLRRVCNVKLDLELSERSTSEASEALIEFMVLYFTEETKSEATWLITSGLIYYGKNTS